MPTDLDGPSVQLVKEPACMVMVGGIPWRLELVHDYLLLEGNKTLGICDADGQTIQISNRCMMAKRWEVFWHELAHAFDFLIWNQKPLSGEALADAIATGMFAFMPEKLQEIADYLEVDLTAIRQGGVQAWSPSRQKGPHAWAKKAAIGCQDNDEEQASALSEKELSEAIDELGIRTRAVRRLATGIDKRFKNGPSEASAVEPTTAAKPAKPGRRDESRGTLDAQLWWLAAHARTSAREADNIRMHLKAVSRENPRLQLTEASA